MSAKSNLELLLEDMAGVLPEPYESQLSTEALLKSSPAQKLIAGGQSSVDAILQFLSARPNPALARPAVILLSYFDPQVFYPALLATLEKADQDLVQAYETGFWLIRLPEQQVAHDLVQIATIGGNPYPLLLLQRPAAKTVRHELVEIIRQHRLPASLFALYCYEYAMEPDDVPWMLKVSTWTESPQLSALAGVYLLKLGKQGGLEGIRAGLLAASERVRAATYQEVRQFLPNTAIDHAQYDPRQQGADREAAVGILIRSLSALPKT